jgi:hypothetical protein
MNFSRNTHVKAATSGQGLQTILSSLRDLPPQQSISFPALNHPAIFGNLLTSVGCRARLQIC